MNPLCTSFLWERWNGNGEKRAWVHLYKGGLLSQQPVFLQKGCSALLGWLSAQGEVNGYSYSILCAVNVRKTHWCIMQYITIQNVVTDNYKIDSYHGRPNAHIHCLSTHIHCLSAHIHCLSTHIHCLSTHIPVRTQTRIRCLTLHCACVAAAPGRVALYCLNTVCSGE